MYNFDLKLPKTTAEAVAMLQEEGAQALSGGQTLIPTLKARLAAPSVLVALNGIAENRYLRREGDTLVIGGATTHAQVASESKAHFPALAFLAGHIGDPGVRNRGTMGGSVANNDPSACYPSAILATGGTIVTDRREIAADDFFLGMFTTALEEGEIVTAVRMPIPIEAGYRKFYQPASRFAMAGAFVARFADRAGVGITGASNNGAFRWTEAEAALSANYSPAAVEALSPPDSSEMISDIHGTAEYRAHLVKVMTARAVTGSALG